MAKHYVTFGDNHQYEFHGKTTNGRTAVCYDAPNPVVGRELAFALFDGKFSMEYHDKEFKQNMITDVIHIDINEEIIKKNNQQ